MALYRLEFLVSNDVNITSGTKTVTINDSVDVSSVVPGTAIFINNQVVEALSGQNVSPTQSTIELRYNWPFATVTTGRLVAFNTFEGLNTAISRLNDIINSTPDFTGATGEGFLYNDGSDTYTIKASTVFGESLLNSASASAARTLLELLPASTSEAQDGTDDSKYMTPLKTHQSFNRYGLGAFGGSIDNDMSVFKVVSFMNGGVTAANDSPAGFAGRHLSWYVGSANYGAQFAFDANSTAQPKATFQFRRWRGNSPNMSWACIYHSESLGHFQNLSGSNVAPNSTVAGSSLSPAKSGTWRNVSGGDIVNNGYGLFEVV